jgi:hypothetical protein
MLQHNHRQCALRVGEAARRHRTGLRLRYLAAWGHHLYFGRAGAVQELLPLGSFLVGTAGIKI